MISNVGIFWGEKEDWELTTKQWVMHMGPISSPFATHLSSMCHLFY